MSNNGIDVKNEVPGTHDDLSIEQLDAVSAGFPIIKVLGHTVTTGDVASAASWVWHKFF